MPTKREREQQEQLDVLAGHLHSVATETVGRRQSLETRWIEDFRQLEGRYKPQVEEELQRLEQSYSFANNTRPKTDAAISRLLDILQPQDEDLFDLHPTPSPVLINMQGSQAPTGIVDPATGQQVTEGQVALRVRTEAKRRARQMKIVIKDQMDEADWPAVMRQMITSGCEYGTGVVQGPIVEGRIRNAWVPAESDDGSVVHAIQTVVNVAAGLRFVPIWNFFPDMAATRMKDAQFVFVRHRYNKHGMRQLAKQPGMRTDVLREVIESGPTTATSDNAFGELREVTGVVDQNRGEFWEVWEYHGPVDDDAMLAAGVIERDDKTDPLRGTLGEIWFVDNRTIRFALNPLEPQVLPFHVFNYDPDPTCIFGRGIPYRIRNSQDACNASWRMMHDNGALSAGGQIIMDQSVMPAPEYGAPTDRKLRPRKVWLNKEPLKRAGDAFAQFTFDGQLQQLQMLYQMGRQLIDEESGFPAVVQGDAQSTIAQNATGLTVLSNLALTLMKRPVRNFDDEVTDRLVTAFYHWNMAHHDDPAVKGDYDVIVRGSQYLVTKEVRAQNAVWLAQQVLTNPLLVPFADARKAFRSLVHAAQHDPAEWMTEDALTEDDTTADPNEQMDPQQQQMALEQQMAEQQAAMEQAKLQLEQAKLQLKQLEIQQNERESIREAEIDIAQMATQQQISVEQMRSQLATEAMKDATKNREMDIKIVTGQGI